MVDVFRQTTPTLSSPPPRRRPLPLEALLRVTVFPVKPKKNPRAYSLLRLSTTSLVSFFNEKDVSSIVLFRRCDPPADRPESTRKNETWFPRVSNCFSFPPLFDLILQTGCVIQELRIVFLLSIFFVFFLVKGSFPALPLTPSHHPQVPKHVAV